MAFCRVSGLVLLISLASAVVEEHNGMVTSFKYTKSLEEKIQEQRRKERLPYSNDEFVDKRKKFAIQDLGSGGYEIKILVDSTWRKIQKTTTCFVTSGSYRISELSFVLTNAKKKNKVRVFLKSETLVGWTMIPAENRVFKKVSVQIVAPPLPNNRGQRIIPPAGFCREG